MLHALQLSAFVCVFVSQPLFGFPSQSAYPVAQVGTHVPAGQAVVPFAFVHVTPQLPQLLVLSNEASQPFVGLPSQLSHPVLHAESWQLPVVHDDVALARLHATPQLPQLVEV